MTKRRLEQRRFAGRKVLGDRGQGQPERNRYLLQRNSRYAMFEVRILRGGHNEGLLQALRDGQIGRDSSHEWAASQVHEPLSWSLPRLASLKVTNHPAAW